MHDISNTNEARKLLENDDFSTENARALLLYLIERDERWKRNAEKINAAFLALFQLASTQWAVTSQLPMPPSVKPDLDAMLEALKDCHELITGDQTMH